MTIVGHSLAGLSIGVACLPGFASRVRGAAFLACFAALACVPDLPVPGWGGLPYDARHSLLVNLASVCAATAALACFSRVRRSVGGWPVVVCGAAAWMSHLALDSFYNHGYGVVVGWPFSRARLNLAMPWFRSLPEGMHLDVRTLRVVLIEMLFYGAILSVCVAVRLKRAGIARKEVA